MNEEQNKLFYELKQSFIQHSYKWNVLVDIEQLILDLQHQNEFLMKRENKLQMIEQMFNSGIVDLEKLSKLVKGEVVKEKNK